MPRLPHAVSARLPLSGDRLKMLPRPPFALTIGLTVLAGLLAALSLAAGPAALTPGDVWAALVHDDGANGIIVRDIMPGFADAGDSGADAATV